VRKLHNMMHTRVQTDLQKLGFYGGSIDGLMGAGTQDAIRAFRKQAKLSTSDTIDAKLTQALRVALQRQNQATSRTKPSNSPESIKALQENLLVLGLNPGVPDGLIGSATTNAIRDFQTRHKLAVTGQVTGEWRTVLERELLQAIQNQLSAYGLEPGPADGAFGSRTEQAIIAFQKQIKLPVDGQPSAQLLSALQKATTARQTAVTQQETQRHQRVEQAQTERIERTQRRLQALGFKIKSIDGEPGPETQAAVRQFQQQQRLPIDGQVSEQLITALDDTLKTRGQDRQTAVVQEKITPNDDTLKTAENNRQTTVVQEKITPSSDVSIEPTAVKPETPPAPKLSEFALISEIQSRLSSLGYDAGSADGKAGARTQRAIRAFQSQLNLTANGQPSLELLNTIKSTPLAKARAITPKRTAASSKGKNTEVRGRLVLQKSSNGTLVGCSISGVQLDPSWCRPFAARNNTRDCKAILRSTSKVLLVKCG
jgi:peptidoglycan hydrolase-like protein with peptidoglycan-binding domain